MISEMTQWIMELMRDHGQLSVFIGVMIEQIVVPIPSPMIIMGAGAVLIPSGLSIPRATLEILWIIVLPGTIASTLGSYIGYLISYYGGMALVGRFQRFLDVNWKEIQTLEERFRGRKVSLCIFLTRAIPVFPISLISILAGFLRIPIGPFTIYTFTGSIFRCLALGFIGWWVGMTYKKVATRLDSVETIVSIVMLMAMLGGLGYLYRKFRKTR